MDVIIRDFRINKASIEIVSSYNIAPSQDVLIISADENGERQLETCKWGFLPFWAKDPTMAHKMINARSETIATKPAFRDAFKKHRCLVIADGFYEWQKKDKSKVPFYVHQKSGKPFGFAGLFSHWSPEKEAEGICTCTIITTDANKLLMPIHDRMPVIVPKDKEDLWLDPTTQEQEALKILKPYPSEEIEVYEVSTKVNSPRYDGQDLISPISSK